MLLFFISTIGGLFGGFLSALNSKGALDLPEIQKTPITNKKSIRFGFLKQTIVGIGAGLVVTGIILIIPYELPLMSYLALSIIGGFGGGKTLSTLSDTVTNSVEDIVKDLPKKKDN